MKKLLTVFAVVALAAASQAAQFSWGSFTWNNERTWDDGYAGGGTVYQLFKFSAAEAAAAGFADSSSALEGLGGVSGVSSVGTEYNKDTGMTNLGGTLLDSYTISDLQSINGNWEGSPYAEDEKTINAWYMVTEYDPSTPDFFDAVAFQFTSLSNTDAGGSAPLNALELGQHMHGTVVSNPSGDQPIPEPATAALLALGLAAFGLKRKTRA